MNEIIDVIIPSRKEPLQECIRGVRNNTPPITSYKVIVDDGRGQTRIRYEGALNSTADYIFLLDDDAEMHLGVVQAYLDKIREGYDAVCGSTIPKPMNKFSERVVQFMTNEETAFYPVGCTLWRREKFIQIMNEVGININPHLGDNRLQEQIVRGGYKVFKCRAALTDHIWATTPSKFFKKRLSYGRAIGEMYLEDGVFLRNYLKFLVAIPLSTNRGIFLYRLATWIAMTQFILEHIDRQLPITRKTFQRRNIRVGD